jgi:hypothetical protein
MATPLSRLKVQTIDEQIAEATARKEAELAQEIQQIKLAAEVDDARFELKQKIQGEFNTLQKKQAEEDKVYYKEVAQSKANFKAKYGVDFEVERKPFVIPMTRDERINLKAKLASELTVNDKPKYSLNADETALIGTKGTPITSLIDVEIDGKKEKLSARNLFKYLKPEATKEELDERFPPKDTTPKEYREQRLEQFNNIIEDTEKE